MMSLELIPLISPTPVEIRPMTDRPTESLPLEASHARESAQFHARDQVDRRGRPFAHPQIKKSALRLPHLSQSVRGCDEPSHRVDLIQSHARDYRNREGGGMSSIR